jgi:hypothetical protein
MTVSGSGSNATSMSDWLIWVFFATTDKYIVLVLQCLVSSRIKDCCGKTFILIDTWIYELYELTTEKSQLRRYFVDLCAHAIFADSFIEDWKDTLNLNAEFAAGVSMIIINQKDLGNRKKRTHPYDMDEDREFRLRAAFYFLWNL